MHFLSSVNSAVSYTHLDVYKRQPVVGFENHGGRTYIKDHTPFGKVFYGLGNTGKSGYEGVVYKNVIATYLHGPLLPKNPHVCDYLLERALKRKYGPDVTLSPLPDELEHAANQYIVDLSLIHI